MAAALKMRELIIDNCEACKPVSMAIIRLEEIGFIITNQKLRDFHFKELYFLMTSKRLTEAHNLSLEGITQTDNKFICNCHWSIIELTNEK